MSNRTRRGNARRAYLALAGGLLCASSLGLSQSNAIKRSEPTVYYRGLNDVAVAVSFIPDRVGLITRERAGRRQVDTIANAFGLQVQGELSGGLFVLAGEGLDKRDEVIELARAIEAQYPRQIREAGFLVSVEGDANPQLVSDELLVRFDPQKQPDPEGILEGFGMKIVHRGRAGTYRAEVTRDTPFDVLEAVKRLRASEGALFAEPNFHYLADRYESIPSDPLFGEQWHHRNSGASGGTLDADADTTLAWDITQGDASAVIAVVDNTFDIDHEDLVANLHANAGEIAGNGLDDDGNGYIDDVSGWDFVFADNDPRPVAAGDNHGTAVAGVAVARADNRAGVAGACPNCSYIPLSVFGNCGTGGSGCLSNNAAFAEAFDYATFSDAKIITNSWGLGNPSGTASAAVAAAIHDATAAGKLVLFAGGNSPSADYCIAGYPSLADVVAVSSSSNLDRKVNGHAQGQCIDVLSPTRWGGADSPSPTGTLAITTTDRTATAGYNTTDPACSGGLVELGNQRYTRCFSGTSSATPLVAGVAGLLLSERPTLTRVEAQRVLQDTTDRIEDSLGSYRTESGYSQPNTHAFGRINAGEALRLVASDGHAGVDVMLRDNRLDWGNTEQPSNVTFEPVRGSIGHWQSVDIRVDAPPYQTPPTDNASFEALADENAKEGEVNHVFVRVRNRGPVTASSVTVKLHWTQFGTALAALPADFWTAFPADSADTTQWHPLGVSVLEDLAYSGASIAGCPGRAAPDCGGASDAAQITAFDWVGPSVAPGTPNHFCLFGVVDSPQDPIAAASIASFVPDAITPTDNNVTHRNVEIEPAAGGGSETQSSFYLRNPYRERGRSRLQLKAPKGWEVKLDGAALDDWFELRGGEQRLVNIYLRAPEDSTGQVIEVAQEVVVGNQRIWGGAVFEFHKPRN
jgi:subtilisin family serine protease